MLSLIEEKGESFYIILGMTQKYFVPLAKDPKRFSPDREKNQNFSDGNRGNYLIPFPLLRRRAQYLYLL
jgi:hypothetical protein